MGLFGLILVYLLGGLTFIPLLLFSILIHAYLTFPIHENDAQVQEKDELLRPGDSAEIIKAATKGLEEKFQPRGSDDAEAGAGYFAVCREYVPGGVGAVLVRNTPVGNTVITSPSPSVYQSMYRSIFDRKQGPNPLEQKGTGKSQRKGGNVFYVVLRHSHLLLYDDDEQLEVRYVISLAHHNISIYGGGEAIPDGELFIKRNALCLSRKVDAGELTADGTASKPFYLFAENTSEKEDFYFALLKNQDRKPEASNNPPIPLQFDVKHIIGLVQRLHSSGEQMQTRWINAILGRVFLGIYKTSDVENFIRSKITKKISRVKKPSFLSKILVRHVDMGEGAPYITNPRLKDLTVDGDCIVEADIHYTGGFRLEVAATARIDLGSRFKAREVNLVLAVVVKKVEGHVLLKIKKPPTNRFWITFETPPKIEMTIEPIVSARQITYTVILRQIENRIKEVIAESVVMPFWDDVAFFSTEGKNWRGGIWVDDKPSHPPQDLETAAAEDGDVDEVEHLESDPTHFSMPAMEKSMSVPALDASPPSSAYARRTARSVFNMPTKNEGSSSSIDTKSSMSEKPRSIRQGSFTSSSSPVVSTDITNADVFRATISPESNNAALTMAAISARSQPVSPSHTPVGSPSKPSDYIAKIGSHTSASSRDSQLSDPEPHSDLTPQSTLAAHGSSSDSRPEYFASRPSSIISGASHLSDTLKTFTREASRQNSSSAFSTKSSDSAEGPDNTQKRPALTAVANAAASARRWGLQALQRNGNQGKDGTLDREDSHSAINEPMGRGRPLPPPGTPLPRPDRKTKTAPIPVPKRKPLAPPSLPQRPGRGELEENLSSVSRSMPAPALPRRRGNISSSNDDENVFVIAAPPDSEPTSPSDESRQRYLPPWVDDAEDEDDPAEATQALRRSPNLSRRSVQSSSSPEEDEKQLPTWVSAQEAESRAKSMFVDEDAGQLHQ